MALAIARELIARLIEEADRALPEEACGLLLGQGERIERVRPARNVHPAPQTHFEIDPQALIDAHRAARHGGPQVLGYYHSHPHGSPAPSATDRTQASGDGRVWAIVGDGDVAFWRDDEDGFAALSYTVDDR
ncbi:MAG: M67 family metallopeptidase [Porphyrobacter sp.]|nr:M67 family metallopeptidase [Porphyrobacter sp.]